MPFIPIADEITANLGTTDTGYLSAIKTAIEKLDNIVSGSEAQVDIASALPAGDNNIGNVDLASAIPTGANNIGTVAPYAQPADFVSGATADITDTTATSVIAAQGAGVVIYITTLMVSNSDADTGTVVKITDGSGGTTMWSGYAAALGGGYVVNFNIPLVFTANTAVFAQCETTDATVRVNAAGYKV